MILSDRSLHELARKGIAPGDANIGPCSIDLTLGDSYAVIKGENRFGVDFVRLGADVIDYDYKHGINRFIINPHQFVLATTREWIKVPQSMAGFISGRSSVGRAGLQVQNAGFVDAGFEGNLTLELFNQGNLPILLESGTRICQISYHLLDTEAKNSYEKTGKYQKQNGVAGSMMHLD